MFKVDSAMPYKLNEEKIESKLVDGTIYTLEVYPEGDCFFSNYGEGLPVKLICDYEFNDESLIYANGYQSWTDSKEYMPHEKMKSLDGLPKALRKHYLFDIYGDSYFYKYPNKSGVFHGYTISYVRQNDSYLFFGSLNDHEVYTIIKSDCNNNTIEIIPDLDVYLNKPTVVLKFMVLKGDRRVFDVYKSYFPELKIKDKMYGYTSWYNHYQNINEKILLENIEDATKYGFELFQIDDGYATHNGDYLSIDEKKFPNGLKGIVEKIHEGGMKAGLWIAPFITEKRSELVKTNPEYVARDFDGNMVLGGWSWHGNYALDLERDDVRAHIKKMFKHYIDMGFDLFKLDFLYTACLKPNKYKTRAKMMREAMEFLRECCEDKLILGCGVPLASSFNLVDYCRIGADVSLKFDDHWFMKFMHRERVSTKITVQDSIYRHHMDGLGFLNDPDVFILRDENCSMNEKQKYSLTFINYLFGSLVLTSDSLRKYDEKKFEILKEMEPLKKAKVLNVQRKGDEVVITYSIENEEYTKVYNTKTGVIE